MLNFPRENIEIIQSEAFFKNPALYTKRSFEFLNLDVNVVDVDEITATAYNTAPKPTTTEEEEQPIMSEALRLRLVRFFEPYNRALKAIMHQDLDLTLWNMQ